MDFKDNHFRMIFWFLAALSGIILIYDFGITFINIPEKSIRFADAHSSSFTNILIAVVSFFTGAAVGSVSKNKKENAENQSNPNAGAD